MKLPERSLSRVAVVDLVLDQRLADALHHTAVDLPAHDQRGYTRPRSATTK